MKPLANHPFGRISLAWQLAILSTGAVVVVALAGMSAFGARIWNDAQERSNNELSEAARSTSALLDAHFAGTTGPVVEHQARLREMYSGHFELHEIDPGADPALSLWYDGAPLVGNNEILDAFAHQTGAGASVLLRVGDDFERIVTTTVRPDGERAVLTRMGTENPITKLLLRGERYLGSAMVVGTLHLGAYEPIVQGDRVIGALGSGTNAADIMYMVGATMQLQHPLKTGRVYGLRPEAADPARVHTLGLPKDRVVDGKQAAMAGLLSGAHKLDEAVRIDAPAALLGDADADGPHRMFVVWNEGWGMWVVADAPVSAITGDAPGVIRSMALGGLVLLLALSAGNVAFTQRLVGRPIANLIEQLTRFAGNDFSRPIAVSRADEIGRLAQAMERFRGELVRTLSTVRGNAQALAAASRHIADGSKNLNLRTGEQIDLLKYTFTTMDDLNLKVTHNAESADRATALALQASDMAGQGGEGVAQIVKTMEQINDGSRTIAGIIAVIDGIAFQTNILALNAAVEAARAGDQGRGFAVVAAEVRALAKRSAGAASQIKSLVNSSVDQVAQGVAFVDHAGRIILEAVQAARQVRDLIAEVRSASSGQTESVAQVAEAVRCLDRSTQQNVSLVSDSASSAEQLRAQAEQLVHAASAFRLDPADPEFAPDASEDTQAEIGLSS